MDCPTAKTVEVKYKCVCMKEEITLSVLSRRTDEDVVEWMQICVQPTIYLDHRARSPQCRANSMEYAKIHLPSDSEFVGQGEKIQ